MAITQLPRRVRRSRWLVEQAERASGREARDLALKDANVAASQL